MGRCAALCGLELLLLSLIAAFKLDDFLPKFVRVLPLEYKRALNDMKNAMIDEKLKAIREEEQLEVTF